MCRGFGVPTPASLTSEDPFCQGFCRRTKGSNKENESASSLLSGQNQVLRVGKTVVFNGKMGMHKFGSAAPPFGKVACAVKVFLALCLYINALTDQEICVGNWVWFVQEVVFIQLIYFLSLLIKC